MAEELGHEDLAYLWVYEHHKYDSSDPGFETVMTVLLPDGNTMDFDVPAEHLQQIENLMMADRAAALYLVEHFSPEQLVFEDED